MSSNKCSNSAHAGGVFGYIINNIPEIPYRPLHPGCLNIEEYCSSHRCNQSWNKNNAFYVASDCACMYMESVWQLLFIGYHSTIYYFSSPYLAEETVVEAYHLICELGLRLVQLAMYHSDTGCRKSPYVYPISTYIRGTSRHPGLLMHEELRFFSLLSRSWTFIK